MIESVTLTNFKSLEDVTIPLSQITILIGPNGSGKSSVLQALMLLKQSLGQGAIRWNEPYVALGSFLDVVHKHDTGLDMSISIIGKTRTATGSVFGTGRYDFRYLVNLDQSGFRDHEGTVLLGNGDAGIAGLWERGQTRSIAKSSLNVPPNIGLNVQPSPTIGRPFVAYPASYPTDASKLVEEIRVAASEISSVITSSIQNVFLVPALRGIDRPDVDLNDAPVDDFVTVRGPQVQASNVASTLGYDPELADRVSKFTRKITGATIRQRLIPNKRTSIEALGPTFRGNLVNEGSGLNQLVFSFSQLSRAPPGSLIGIEEPELHLHPKAQGGLVDSLVEIAKSEDKQMVISTHSEHVLFRLLTSVARGELSGNLLSVLRFEKKDETTSSVSNMKIDPQGRIEGGLPGFFEEDVKEFQEYLNALQYRKKRSN